MHLTRGAAALSAAALITTGLSACGDDEPVEPTSSSTVSPLSGDSTTTSSPTSGSTSSDNNSSSGAKSGLPDDIPAAALKETKEGAAAFGKYYYESLGEAGLTGDTSPLKKLDAAECKVCSTAIKGIEDERAKGWSRNKNPYSVTKVEAVKRQDSGYKVSMTVAVAAHQRVDAKGKINGRIDATQYTLTEHVVWQDGLWQMVDWIVT